MGRFFSVLCVGVLVGCGGAQGNHASAGLSPEVAVSQLDQGMSARGFTHLGATAHVPALASGQSVAHALTVTQSRCYEGVALGVGADQVSILARGPDGEVVGEADMGPHPSVFFCTEVPGSYRFLVTSEGGAAEYYFVSYQAEPDSEASAQEVIAEREDAESDPGQNALPTPTAARGSAAPGNLGQGNASQENSESEVFNPWSHAGQPADDEPSDEEFTPPAPTETPGQRMTRARTLFQQGLSYVRDGNAALGAVYLRQAFELAQRPGVLINLAAAEAQLGHHVAAAEAYTRYLTLSGDGVNERARRAARRALRVLHPEVAWVHFTLPRNSRGSAKLNGNPVESWMDDVDYPVEPGTQDLVYNVDGEVRGIARVVVQRGARAVLRLAPPE